MSVPSIIHSNMSSMEQSKQSTAFESVNSNSSNFNNISSTQSPTSPLSHTFFDTLSVSHGLSSSCSSLSSNTSNVSVDSNYIPKSLSNEIAVHLMVYNSIEVLSRRYKNDQIFYKITYFDMNHTMEINQQQQQQVGLDEESLGIGDEYIAEIGVMNNQEYKFHNQEQFGRLLTPNEFVIFRTRMPITDNVGLRVDLFKKTNVGAELLGNAQDSMFEKIAFCYIYPLDIKESNGICCMPITSKTGKLIARIKAEYFIARPYDGLYAEHKIKSKTRNTKSWQLKKNGLDIGHRGSGSARRYDQDEKVLENTVESFNYAFKKGADMVELDVQLSKDKVPIVYHDFNVNIILQKKDKDIETFAMNIKDLTFNQLQKLKLNPVLHGKDAYDFDETNNLPNNQPFASFQNVLQSVDPECGFNVEIKYPQKKINGQWESEKSHDLNEYVDLILQDLFHYAGERTIKISSFHPELCALVKLKQDRYPVLFLTQGLTKKWIQYENPLNHSIEMATYLALSNDLYGIAVHAEDILKDRNLIRFVKSKALVLFCWGDDLNDRNTIKNLKKEGIDGAIYDKIDLLVAKEDQLTEEQAMEI